ncbi:MAG: argininosuccinate lyase [Crocinitomicaceae bacterium]|nr:argininosuccinate lyase [Flavobacteriales bacterium]NQZ37543.1 argininosuccinate lyase [Crocinitomicaceae bacterium]
MKLWDKGYTIDNVVDKFTVGNDRVLDLKLVEYDIQGNCAHAKMLNHIGVLSDQELDDILSGLKTIQATVDNGTFVIEESFEDVHSKVEFELTRLIGEAGKKIHTARSRNDQVLVDLHLYAKNEINEMTLLVNQLFERMLSLAEEHKEVLMPGYTHMQVAMPSSFGLWFSGYAECLIDDLYLMNAAYKICDQNPLGSAAGYGSSFPIDRLMTTKLLGFETLKYNVIAAQMSRGKMEKSLAFAMASVAGTLSRFAADICLYMSQNFNFIGFPKELTTGSSIMPHKKNPDVFELMRAKCNKIQNLPSEIMMITNNLTVGYHRDFQLLKESLMGGIDELKNCLDVCDFMLKHIEIKSDFLDNDMYNFMYTVEDVNKLVIDGVPFREAYQIIGEKVLNDSYVPTKEVRHSHEGSIGNLCLEEIREKFRSIKE